MRIAGIYSFNGGEEAVTNRYSELFEEIKNTIASVNAEQHRSKQSKEKTMPDKMLFSPISLNQAFKKSLYPLMWKNIRVACDYPTKYYLSDYQKRSNRKGAFREMDFVKQKLGIEVQFGKYAFMVYNVCAKMTIFRNLGYIDTGIEIVPVKAFADEMSTGVSYFEQFVWDLESRGVSNIDIPVLILGIDA